jgi:hypothetical protein
LRHATVEEIFPVFYFIVYGVLYDGHPGVYHVLPSTARGDWWLVG